LVFEAEESRGVNWPPLGNSSGFTVRKTSERSVDEEEDEDEDEKEEEEEGRTFPSEESARETSSNSAIFGVVGLGDSWNDFVRDRWDEGSSSFWVSIPMIGIDSIRRSVWRWEELSEGSLEEGEGASTCAIVIDDWGEWGMSTGGCAWKGGEEWMKEDGEEGGVVAKETEEKEGEDERERWGREKGSWESISVKCESEPCPSTVELKGRREEGTSLCGGEDCRTKAGGGGEEEEREEVKWGRENGTSSSVSWAPASSSIANRVFVAGGNVSEETGGGGGGGWREMGGDDEPERWGREKGSASAITVEGIETASPNEEGKKDGEEDDDGEEEEDDGEEEGEEETERCGSEKGSSVSQGFSSPKNSMREES
jgi:hypothetical protein